MVLSIKITLLYVMKNMLNRLFLKLFTNKMKHNKCHTVATVLKSNRKKS